MEKKLEWYVYNEDFNGKEIKPFNVFNSVRFNDCLIRLKKELKKNGEGFDWFNEQLKFDVKYSFWSKCEYEILLTRLFDENCHQKIDVYAQLELNWDKFAKYVFENLALIKTTTKRRKGE